MESSSGFADASEYTDESGALPIMRDGASLVLNVQYFTWGRAGRHGEINENGIARLQFQVCQEGCASA